MRVPNLYYLDVKKDESGSFECKHCGKKFDRRKGYIYHVVNTHTANRNFPCTHAQCNYKAKNQMLLTRHINRLHKQVFFLLYDMMLFSIIFNRKPLRFLKCVCPHHYVFLTCFKSDAIIFNCSMHHI
jgi:uncharacterized C2H2 Zn-finger protein